MAAAPPAARDEFRDTLRAALQTADTARTPKTRAARSNVFDKWTGFCRRLLVREDLSDVAPADRLSFLLVFGMLYREGRFSSHQVRSGTVQDALLAVGKGLADLGTPDPRLLPTGRTVPLLADFYSAMADQDSPSTRQFPANLTLLRHLPVILDTDHPDAGAANTATIDLAIVGFFWLLRPAEYLYSRGQGRSTPFRLCDICFAIRHGQHLASTAPLHDVNPTDITAATLTFTDQKNGVRGEQIGHRSTSDPLLCPCKALFRLARRLRLHHAPPDTPIYTYYAGGSPQRIPPAYITNALRHSAAALQPLTGIDPQLLSARSLRPGGATALLCAQVDPNVIQLLGRWRSDAMLRYLRVAATTVTHTYSQHMLHHGAYTFAPGTYTSATTLVLPRELPSPLRALTS